MFGALKLIKWAIFEFQNDALEVQNIFFVKMSFICMKIKNLFFISLASHLASDWNGGLEQLGNGLLNCWIAHKIF